MKMNPEYIRNLLISIESIDSARPSLCTIIRVFFDCDNQQVQYKINDEFVLHYQLLFDYGFVEPVDRSNGIYEKNTRGGQYNYADVDVRLTAHGHEFLAAIEKDNVWTVIQDKFKEESLDTIFTISKQIMTNFAKKKLAEYMD